MLANALRRLGFGQLAENTLVGMLWQFARIAAQVIWVVLIARSLGPSGYGTFAGIAGLATTLGGVAGLGTGWLLLQHVSRNKSTFDMYWRKASLTTLFSGLILAALFYPAARLIAGSYATAMTIAAVGLSELVCYPLVYLVGFAFQAHERLGWSSALATMMSGARLLAAMAFLSSSFTRDLTTYALFHVGASMLTMICALLLGQTMLRPQRTSFVLHIREIKEGLSFAAVWFTGNAVTELDKTLALRLGGGTVAGIYSAAYRFVSALTLPVASLALAAQPRLFRQSANPPDGSSRLVLRLALVAMAYGMAASLCLWLLANFLPVLLGKAFDPAARAARLLVLVPPLFALRLIGNAVLMTSGRQLMRVLIEAFGALILIGLANLWIPSYGIAGVAMAVTSTEALLAAGIWAMLWTPKKPQRSLGSTTIFPSKIQEAE